MKGEISTSAMVWMVIAIVVLVILLIGVPNAIKGGFGFFDDTECRAQNDADNDGTPDIHDTCPCDEDNLKIGKDCRACREYTEACK